MAEWYIFNCLVVTADTFKVSRTGHGLWPHLHQKQQQAFSIGLVGTAGVPYHQDNSIRAERHQIYSIQDTYN